MIISLLITSLVVTLLGFWIFYIKGYRHCLLRERKPYYYTDVGRDDKGTHVKTTLYIPMGWKAKEPVQLYYDKATEEVFIMIEDKKGIL